MSSWDTAVSSGTPNEETDEENEQEEETSQAITEEQLREVKNNGRLGDLTDKILTELVEVTDDEELLKEVWLDLPESRSGIVEDKVGEFEDESNSSPQVGIESVEDLNDSSAGEDTSTSQKSVQEHSRETGGPPEFGNSMSLKEATAIDRRWKVMVWGPPKMYKTHFGYTMPKPIAYLDLEGKANDIAGKFPQDEDIRMWQPRDMQAEPDTKFRRSKKALKQAIEWLDWYRLNEDRKGTIVVDSMSQMWEWAQIHHKLENYPLKDPSNVELSSNFGNDAESDWAVIKEYHNGEFRDLITDSPYHYYWTCMEREDFQQTLDDGENRTFYEPRGEPNNDYKVDTILRARTDEERGKVGDLLGSNFTDNMFVALKKPTFPKLREAIQNVEEAEKSSEGVSRKQLSNKIDAETIIDYDPQIYTQ